MTRKQLKNTISMLDRAIQLKDSGYYKEKNKNRNKNFIVAYDKVTGKRKFRFTSVKETALFFGCSKTSVTRVIDGNNSKVIDVDLRVEYEEVV